jgi:hypothetical protein
LDRKIIGTEKEIFSKEIKIVLNHWKMGKPKTQMG